MERGSKRRWRRSAKALRTRGTVETVRRWMAPVDERAAAQGPARVLVVDDSADLCELVADLLRSEGCLVETALSGAAALARAARFHPDVALVDLGLPDMDGTEVARRLRLPEGAPAPRLVAMTGRTEPEELERALAAGFSEHLLKPFDPEALTRAVRR